MIDLVSGFIGVIGSSGPRKPSVRKGLMRNYDMKLWAGNQFLCWNGMMS